MMPKLTQTLAISLLVLLILSGCAAQPPAPGEPSPTPLPQTSQAVETPAPTPPSTPTPEPVAPEASPVATPAPPAPFPPTISLQPFLSVRGRYTYLTHAGDGSGRLFLVEKAGRIWIIAEGRVLETPFLDITRLIDSGPSERGLLSLAFDPNYEENGEFYVDYTGRKRGETVIARYRVSDDAQLADPESAQIILTVDQPAPNHNGGQLQFGPDGYLYVGMGDGGRANDPWDNAERLDVLLGKLLRLDVRGRETYAIPPDNPFINTPDARPEIWAYGLRNPWRFSFDRKTGDLYIADVGQNLWEEINFQPADSAGGEHYGWDTLEGSHCFEPAEGCDKTGKIMPVAEYSHQEGCSVTGGYVYRGRAYPLLDGIYFFADFCTGRIWALQQQKDGAWAMAVALDSDINVASFGEDEAGELYIIDLEGDIYRLVGVQ